MAISSSLSTRRSTLINNRVRRLAFLLCAGLSACGGGGGGAPGASTGVTLVLNPAEVTLGAGGTVQFAAEIQGTGDTRARFELISGPGAVTADGLYSAPSTLGSAGATASVRAVALADERAVAVATVRLGAGGGNGNGNGGMLESLGAKVGTGVATEVGDGSRRSLLRCVASAVEAARLTGQPRPVLVGTLRLQSGQATYEPTPTDRLMVISGSEPAATFRITSMNGDFSSGGNNFFDSDHDFAAQVELSGVLDVQATSQRRARAAQRMVRGSAILDGNSFAVDVNETDDIFFDSSGGGIQVRVRTTVRGSVEGQGISVQLQDDVNVLAQRTTFLSVETQRTLASTWEVNGARYELRDGRLNKVFRDARATELSFWRAEGTILKDGVAIGSLRGDFENSFYVVRLVRGDERVELIRVFLNV